MRSQECCDPFTHRFNFEARRLAEDSPRPSRFSHHLQVMQSYYLPKPIVPQNVL